MARTSEGGESQRHALNPAAVISAGVLRDSVQFGCDVLMKCSGRRPCAVVKANSYESRVAFGAARAPGALIVARLVVAAGESGVELFDDAAIFVPMNRVPAQRVAVRRYRLDAR